MANKRDLAGHLLQRASDDAAAARAMLLVESVTDLIVATLAQQAVEKSVKAVLAVRGVDFPFTHDLGGLARICKENEVPLPDDLDGVDQLTPYAGALRYDAEDPKLVDRATALRWATGAVSWAQAQVQSTAAPSPETEHQEGT
jgi:HEPN domain-containing protein